MPTPRSEGTPDPGSPATAHRRPFRLPPIRPWAILSVAALATLTAVGVGVAAQPDGDSPPGTATAATERLTEDHGDRSHEREAAPEPEPSSEDTESSEAEAPQPETPPQPVAGLDETQMANAVTVVEIGRELGFSERGQAVALVTAMQESLLRNVASTAVPESLDYPHEGIMIDYDSVGLFQQRPSMGWGTVAECMDVEYSTTVFYRALDEVAGWEDMELTVAAQAVQRSAYPDRYAQWEDMAWAVIAEMNG
ncbi:hypothetical protein LX16_3753 [Stackebrandtia albiflava]|uniref:Peptidase M23-like protein n=1 Tax=Stackebrandtia albiflava TaxID=406432 RepID=A0A562V522_9ACTN|nr:hypothetical protein [Stackebrandtia albiflava]TWJ12986.1 hypothetical protein LX16_3753 [Stackebrandtia albiflava]